MPKIKIICATPKGKSESCSNNFAMHYFSMLKKPIETKVVSDEEFYYIYEMKDKEIANMVNKKIPNAIKNIRKFYTIVIGLVERANKLGKRGAWSVEKMKHWILKQFTRKGGNPKEIEDFIDAIELNDKEQMLIFLSGDIIRYELLE